MKKLLSIACFLVLLANTGHAQELFRALPETLHSAVAADATGKIIKVEGWATVSVHVDGIVTATVTFQVSNDAALGWHNLTCTKSNDGSSVSSLTEDGAVSCPVSGYKYFKAPISGYSDGTITVKTVQTTAASRGGGGGGSGVATSIIGSTTLPGTCTVGQVYFDTDEDANLRITVCTATNTWTPLLETETQSLDDVCTVGCETTTNVSEATGVKHGDGTNKVSMYWDPTGGWYAKPSPLGDSLWRIWTDFDGCVYDEEGAAKMFCYNPDAASSNLMYQYQTGYKAKASFMLPLNPRGAATGAYESIVTNQPTDYYLTLTKVDTDAADFTFVVPARYAGATTVTFRLSGVSKNATPSGNIDLDCAMSAFTPGTDTYTAHVTTGEVTALLTPATQNRPVAVTTSAHTINGGALVAGDVVHGSCEVDATATTSAQMSDFRLKGWILLTLEANSPSD